MTEVALACEVPLPLIVPTLLGFVVGYTFHAPRAAEDPRVNPHVCELG